MATESGEMIEMPKACVDTETMEVDGYDPDTDNAPSRPIKLGANAKINVNRSNGTKDGYLYFTPGRARDGGGYRFFLGVLMAVELVAVIVLAVLLVRGLI